ncbi:MAG: hypothetical protein M3Z41_04950 [Candidatus Eremiobacteraeota bacterium]|nr:hypothetical protein [Candidatus Eremiobacteraeota bacterium]
MKQIVVLVLAVFVIAVVATGGCSSSTTPTVTGSPTPTPSFSPTPTPSPGTSPTPTPTAVNFVVLAYPSVAPTTDPTYGQIDGFGQATAAPTSTPLPTVVSSVITVHCNQTIQFFNLDRTSSMFHTASLLGQASGSNWPLWNNVNGPYRASPVLTAITYPQFSTGTLLPLGTGSSNSLVYTTGTAAGAFYFGDYYQYSSTPPMRTVINILCP